jgi:hypothetical protein
MKEIKEIKLEGNRQQEEKRKKRKRLKPLEKYEYKRDELYLSTIIYFMTNVISICICV